MTNAELIQRMESLVRHERKITHQIIELIQMADSRKLYLELGYGSLFDWLTKHFHYSAPAAYRRIQAARLLSSLPEQTESMRKGVQSGSLTISALSKIQSFIKAEEKRSGSSVSSSLKSEILNRVENQTLQETERILFQSFPEAGQEIQAERVFSLNDQERRLSLTLSEVAFSELKRVQELLGHALPEASLADVIAYLSKDFLKRKDPLNKSAAVLQSGARESAGRARIKNRQAGVRKYRPSIKSNETVGEKQSAQKSENTIKKISLKRRFPLPAELRRFVHQRDQGRCQFKHSESGQICGSRVRVEIDHIHPLALGGGDSAENLRCLCRNHNQWRAKRLNRSASGGKRLGLGSNLDADSQGF